MEYLFVRIADLFYLHLRFVLFTFCNLMWANLYPNIVYDWECTIHLVASPDACLY